ncbi:MAG: S41 family peptidase [Bacteroidales bacterium]|nr:S41 family peptidase [Candidatus Liminaster caballi]
MHTDRLLLTMTIAAATACCSLTSCLDDETLGMDDSHMGNFEACWRAMDEHYCFFDQKNVDWDSVYAVYAPYFRDSVDNVGDEFFLLADMLAEVRDGHVNLYSSFNTARYWAWYEDYDLNFDPNLVERYYLGTDYWITSGISYTMLKDSVAYMRYSSFSNTIGEANLDYVLAALRQAKGLIIDVRNNGGGALTNVPVLASRFCTERRAYSYMMHKTGKGHSDFSDPQPLYLEPDPYSYNWDASVQPVVVLTNRQCYSATNNFVAAMRSLDGTMTIDSTGQKHPKMIKTLGDRTGGGGGMPFESVLPNGWVVRFSACPILDHRKRQTEDGIEPDMKVSMDSIRMFEQHVDDIIDSARAYININTRMTYPKKETEE